MSNGIGYDEVLSLEFFRRTIENCNSKRVDQDLFGPLLRNLDNEQVIFKMRDEFIPAPDEEADEEERREYARWKRRCELETAKEVCASLWHCASIRDKFRERILRMVDELLGPMRIVTENDPLKGRISELKRLLRLDDNELSIVLVLWLVNTGRLEPAGSIYATSQLTGFLNLCMGMSEQSVRFALGHSAKLCRYGLVSQRERSELAPKIRYYLDGITVEPLASSFYRKDTEEVLPMEFFGKLAKEHLPFLKRLLAAKTGRHVNILLYGAPGTGKTSFARALARETGRTCYQIAQRPRDRNGDFTEAKAEIRYVALEVCNDQTNSDSSLIVVDEADSLLRCTNMGILEMFGRSSSVTGDKGLLNDILERIETPTIWITNTPAEELDLSNRRRFDYSIRFDPLTESQREQIWKNAASKAGISGKLSDSDVKRLAVDYPVNAGIVARALENVARVKASKREAVRMLRQLLDRQCELSGVDREPIRQLAPARDYTLEGLNIKSSIPLEKVVCAANRFLNTDAARKDLDAPRMNILLSGVPGSGKTEFVKYLSSRLHRPLIVRRPSDLKSKWVGETEQNIAAAFREAREKHAVLFFDEVDTFLDNREALSQGHEKSMVNEVLQQMENFGGLFVGTSNFARLLDPAVARRFTFKIELDYLTPSGKRHFFRKFFGTSLTPEDEAALDRIERLTPGDFRTVRQELYYLGDDVSNADRIAALEAEVCAKPADKCTTIGF